MDSRLGISPVQTTSVWDKSIVSGLMGLSITRMGTWKAGKSEIIKLALQNSNEDIFMMDIINLALMMLHWELNIIHMDVSRDYRY